MSSSTRRNRSARSSESTTEVQWRDLPVVHLHEKYGLSLSLPPAHYSLETIHGIVNSSSILHVSFNAPDTPFPAILPMLGAMGSFERPSADLDEVLDLYLHGYVSSRLVNMSRQSDTNGGNESAEPEAEIGLPVSVAASFNDGLVLALTPFSHSYNYRSAVLFGHATVVTDLPEKLYAMELITDNVIPGRWAGSRSPPTPAEMQSTSVLRVRIASGSAKIRTGGANDAKEDLENDEVMDRVWTGVLPVYETVGEPVAAKVNRVPLPKYIEEFRKYANEESKMYAEVAVTKPMAPKPELDD
jgi:uncharacterized protein